MRKRLVAVLLTTTLVFSGSMPVWAAEETDGTLENELEDVAGEEIGILESYEEPGAEEEAVEVDEDNAENNEDSVALAENDEDVVKISETVSEVDENGLTWNLTDGVLTISGNGVIEKESPLTEEQVQSVTSVVIEEGVAGIGDNAFRNVISGYANLTEVSIPNSVTKIGSYAFQGCKNLSKIAIPSSVTEIGEYAFVNCNSLTAITIPEGMTEIKTKTFGSCRALSEVSLPNSLTKIGGSAFGDCGFTTISIPDSVTEIGDAAFFYCENLTEIAIPVGVTEIKESTFWGCKNLTKVTIPNSVTEIGKSAFADCEKLPSVIIPNSVTEIGENVFRNCEKLSNMTIPKGVTKIAYRAFEGCKSLPEVTIPESVKSIGGSAFAECTGIQSIVFKGNAPEISKKAESATPVGEHGEPFHNVTATAYYPAGNKTYTDEVKAAYGSELTWEEQEMLFTDVNKIDWYYEAAGFVFARGIMTGMNAAEFGPSVKLSRAQFATILYRMEEEPEVEYDASAFPDVNDNQFYSFAAIWAKSTGIITGYENGTFGPADEITREQMAVMMYRYADMLGLDTSAEGDMGGFPDAGKVSSFADKAVKWAIGEGLIQGDGGNVNPQGSAERAQCAIIIMRFMEAYGL